MKIQNFKADKNVKVLNTNQKGKVLGGRLQIDWIVFGNADKDDKISAPVQVDWIVLT